MRPPPGEMARGEEQEGGQPSRVDLRRPRPGTCPGSSPWPVGRRRRRGGGGSPPRGAARPSACRGRDTMLRPRRSSDRASAGRDRGARPRVRRAPVQPLPRGRAGLPATGLAGAGRRSRTAGPHAHGLLAQRGDAPRGHRGVPVPRPGVPAARRPGRCLTGGRREAPRPAGGAARKTSRTSSFTPGRPWTCSSLGPSSGGTRRSNPRNGQHRRSSATSFPHRQCFRHPCGSCVRAGRLTGSGCRGSRMSWPLALDASARTRPGHGARTPRRGERGERLTGGRFRRRQGWGPAPPGGQVDGEISCRGPGRSRARLHGRRRAGGVLGPDGERGRRSPGGGSWRPAIRACSAYMTGCAPAP